MPATAENPSAGRALGPETSRPASANPAIVAAPDRQIDSAEQTCRRLGQQDLTAVPGGHHPRCTVEHRTEVVPIPQLGLTGRQPHPHRQLQPRCAATAASTADLGDANAAHTPSPVCLNRKPPWVSIAVRNTASWAANAARIASASASHRRVEPSTSVNRNVTTPEGVAAEGADTPAASHNKAAPTSHIGRIRPGHRIPESDRGISPKK